MTSPKRLRDRFSKRAILFPQKPVPKWAINCYLPREGVKEEKKITSLLDQRFYQLDVGAQFHVYVSEDSQHILKFFRHSKWNTPPFIRFFPLPPFLQKKRERVMQRKERSRRQTMESCTLAYRHFKEDMVLLYAQVIPREKTDPLYNPFLPKVVLFDSLGKRHLIDLNEVGFVLQRKALPIKDYLLLLKREGRVEKACAVIDQLLAKSIEILDRGFFDRDCHWIINFGLFDEHVIKIDCGSLYCDPSKGKEAFYREELPFGKKILLTWLEKNYKEVFLYAKKKIGELKKRER